MFLVLPSKNYLVCICSIASFVDNNGGPSSEATYTGLLVTQCSMVLALITHTVSSISQELQSDAF